MKKVDSTLVLDLAAHRVWVGDTEVCLSPLEYECITYLAKFKGQIVPYEQLWREVWRSNERIGKAEHETIRSLMKRLRLKLQDTTQSPKHLVIRRGFGVFLRRKLLIVHPD